MSDERTAVGDYICERFAQDDPVLKQVLKNQEAGDGPMMQISADQGKLLSLLVKLLKPKNVLEIGSYYGYSSIWIARAGSQLHCIEVSAKQCAILDEHFQLAGLENVTIHEGSGIDIMNKFINEGKEFEMIFVDADKTSYPQYLDLAAKLIPRGGLLLVDNCLWKNRVVDPSENDKQTQAIREFNDKLAAHPDFDATLLKIHDGMAFAVKN